MYLRVFPEGNHVQIEGGWQNAHYSANIAGYNEAKQAASALRSRRYAKTDRPSDVVVANPDLHEKNVLAINLARGRVRIRIPQIPSTGHHLLANIQTPSVTRNGTVIFPLDEFRTFAENPKAKSRTRRK